MVTKAAQGQIPKQQGVEFTFRIAAAQGMQGVGLFSGEGRVRGTVSE